MNPPDEPKPEFRHGKAPAARDNRVAPSINAIQVALAKHPYLKNARVLSDHGELPADVCDHLKNTGLTPSDVKGVYTEGVAYLIASNLNSVEDGLRTALHEVVGHHGLRALLGEHFYPVMHDLYDTFSRDHDAWQDTASRYGYLDTGTAAGQVAFAEEVAAHMAEKDVSLSEFDMLHAEIRAAMREMVPSLPMTETEVTALLQRSRESLIMRHGEPEAAEEVRQRQQRRTTAADRVMRYQREQGTHAPDALSVALYNNGSQVLDDRNLPTRLFHGAGGDMSEVKGMLWGSVNPKLANEYAAMRADMEEPATVMPYYADIQRPFDGDAFKAVTSAPMIPTFVGQIIRQAGLVGDAADAVREMGSRLIDLADREESGPYYSTHDFWYRPRSNFGREGAEIVADMFEQGGFDGVRHTELGHLTYGAFSPAQLHFLDQGASLRGWQPDRNHGEGSMTKRPAFKQWFGDSAVVTQAGDPRVMYHGTAGDIVSFDQRKIRPSDYDAEANGFWFSSSSDTGPANQELRTIMPVYLSIKQPAPYQVVQEVAKQVEQDGHWRPHARSADDETRYRLQDMDFDGFFYGHPTFFSARQREQLESVGEIAFTDSHSGHQRVLKREYFPTSEWRESASVTDVYRYQDAQGETVNLSVANTPPNELLWHLSMDGALTNIVMDDMAESYDKVLDFVNGSDDSLLFGSTRIERAQHREVSSELIETGEHITSIGLYTASGNHITSYESLEDYERQHDVLTAVAFRPEQIKSAIGNRGTFLGNHADIRFNIDAPPRPARLEDNQAFSDSRHLREKASPDQLELAPSGEPLGNHVSPTQPPKDGVNPVSSLTGEAAQQRDQPPAGKTNSQPESNTSVDMPVLSHINAESGQVANKTGAGAQLQDCAQEMVDILDDCGLEVGWMDGGCRIFAEALCEWSGGRIALAVTGSQDESPSHAVGLLALEGGGEGAHLLLDSEGAASPAEMTKKLALLENSPRERVLASGEAARAMLHAFPMEDEAVGMAVRTLNLVLGPFDGWEGGLREELDKLGASRGVTPSQSNTSQWQDAFVTAQKPSPSTAPSM